MTIHNRGIFGSSTATSWADLAAAAENVTHVGIANRPDLTVAAARYLGLATGQEAQQPEKFYPLVAETTDPTGDPLRHQAIQFLVTGAISTGASSKRLQLLRAYVQTGVAMKTPVVPLWLIEAVLLWGDQAMLGELVRHVDEATLFALANLSETEYMRQVRDVHDFIGRTLDARTDEWADVHPSLFWSLVGA